MKLGIKYFFIPENIFMEKIKTEYDCLKEIEDFATKEKVKIINIETLNGGLRIKGLKVFYEIVDPYYNKDLLLL